MVSELSLKDLFRARDAIVMLKDLGFDDEWLLALEKQIEIELSERINYPDNQEPTSHEVFHKIFRPLGELLKEL